MPTVRPSRTSPMSARTPPTPPTTPTPPPGLIDTEPTDTLAAPVPIDQSVARLIDVVAGHDPEGLPLQLSMVWESSRKEEARHALRAAVICRDPLSDLGTLCRDALRTLADLERLAHTRTWHSLADGVGRTSLRACALHNACEFEIGHKQGREQARLLAIRKRLEEAAKLETARCSGQIRAIAGIRAVRCPDIWAIYEQWIETE